MRRRSALSVIGGAVAAMAHGSVSVSDCRARHHMLHDPLLGQIRAIIDKSHGEISYAPWIGVRATESELKQVAGSCMYGTYSWYEFGVQWRNDGVLVDSDAIAVQYQEQFKSRLQSALHLTLTSANFPEASRYELQGAIDDMDSYRLIQTFAYRGGQFVEDDHEWSWFVRNEHKPLIWVHDPLVQYWDKPVVDSDGNTNATVWINVGMDMETSPRVRQSLRKHTGVHKLFKKQVQWKDPGNVPADDPLRRTTIGPCTCCK